MKLPGIGRYTAGAIASIAFDKSTPIVEANTERLFARLLCLRESTRLPSSLATLWQFAEWSLPRSPSRVAGGAGARMINQAAMELGSLVCKPLNPQCSECPLAAQCPTALHGLQNAIPAPKPKKAFTALHHVALIVPHEDRWLLRLNPPGSWWTGLWDFPRVDITELRLLAEAATQGRPPSATLDSVARARIAEVVAATLGLNAEIGTTRFTFTHTVTRYRILLHCTETLASGFPASAAVREPTAMLSASSSSSTPPTAPPGWQWCAHAELSQLPLTAPARKIASLLRKAE